MANNADWLCRILCGAVAAALSLPCAEAASAHDCDVRLKGRLGERLDAMVERHVAARDVDYITAPFLEKTETKCGWQTEFWGKWMHSAVPYVKYLSNESSVPCPLSSVLNASIERGIDRILSSQEPNGYIGNYPDELRCGEGWDVWGMKYTMMGLLHYYDLKKQSDVGETSRPKSHVSRPDPSAARVLEAAKKLCDYVIAEIGPNGKRGRELWQTGNWSGYASSSILEPVIWLYKRVAEKDGKDAAQSSVLC